MTLNLVTGDLMPVFDPAQDGFEIFADRQPAFARNRDRRRRHVVGEFCARPGLAPADLKSMTIALAAYILICTQMNIYTQTKPGGQERRRPIRVVQIPLVQLRIH
jgi:hypothetical protein